MVDIAGADDVRDHEVYAKQVIEESAKRDNAYAEQLLKAGEDSTDDKEEAAPVGSASKVRVTEDN